MSMRIVAILAALLPMGAPRALGQTGTLWIDRIRLIFAW